MSDEMKACPFCQGPAVNVGGDYVTCGAAWNPGCAGHMVRTDLETWNTRAAIEATTVKGGGLVERAWLRLRDANGESHEGRISITRDDLRAAIDTPEAADTITTLKGEIERLGEKLFILSDRLRSHHFFDNEHNAASYEAVVAAFQALSQGTDNVG